MPQFKLIERIPSIEEYRTLCELVGWETVINFEAARDSLAASLYGVVMMTDNQIIGMGRIIGDGAIYFYVQDIIIHPNYQGQGLGQRLVQALVDWLQDNAPDQAFVGLFAAEGTQPFYEKTGFQQHPALTGMFQVIRP